MKVRRRLAVALDAIVTLHELTGMEEPRLGAAAALVDLGGADALRLGVSEASRAPRESAAAELRRATSRLELRMPPSPTLLKVALDVRPDRVVLAGSTGDRGDAQPLDARAARGELSALVRALREAGIPAIARVAGDLEAVKAVHAAGVVGVELDTSRVVDLPDAEQARELERLADASKLAAKLRLGVGVAGALDLRRLPRVLEAMPVAEHVVVGRALLARALLVGLERAVGDFAARVG